MPYYLGQYIGSGLGADPFRPVGSDQPGWSAIDLRPDSSRLDGGGLNACLLFLPVALADARLTLLAESGSETVPANTRNQIKNKLGVAFTDTTFDAICAALLITPPSNGWKGLLPNLRTKRLEIWLNGLLWSRPIIAGSSTASDDFSTTANPISSPPWTQGTGFNERGQALNSHYAQITGATESCAFIAACPGPEITFRKRH